MAELKIKADSGGGTVSFKGPATTTSNAAVQLTLPVDDGTSGQYLKTDGSGALSWATVASPGGATGLSLNDDVKAQFGNSQDLKIYHDPSRNNLIVNGGSLTLEKSDGEKYIHCSSNDMVELYHNGTKQCETSANGLAFPSGKGIDFSATGDGTTMSSELLDDYEEGSFAVTMGHGVTLTQDDLRYIKVGKLVHVSGLISVNSDNSSSHFTVQNLPFACGAGYIDLSTPAVRLNNWNISSDCKWVGGYTEANKIYFQQVRDDATAIALEADSGADIIINLTYIAA